MCYLKHVTSNDIQLLINDLSLLEDGYVINYIIDPFDIFNFSFPYGIEFKQMDRTLDKIGDEMIAYTYIFERFKPIILDEYKLELFYNKDNVFQNLSNNTNSTLFNVLETELKNSNSVEKKEVFKELENSASFLLSSAILTESFLKHFNQIYAKLQIDTFKLQKKNENDESIILNTFKNSIRSNWSETAFKEWVKNKDSEGYFNQENKNNKFSSNNKNRNRNDIFHELRTTHRDFLVIDRVCDINRKVNENTEITGKYLFLYFSSANKSSDIFSMSKTQQHLPDILNKKLDKSIKKYDLLRSAKHSYLLFLFDGNNNNETIDKLTKLKLIADNKEKDHSFLESIKRDDADLYNDYQRKITHIKQNKRDDLEAESIEIQINKHIRYQQALSKMVTNLRSNKDNFPKLKLLYENLLKDATNVSNNITILRTMDFTYSIHSSLSILLKKFIEKKELNLHKGLDGVKGNYQHLPILLFLNEKNYGENKLKNLLIQVIEFVVKTPKIRTEHIQEFFKIVEELYLESEKNESGRLDSLSDYSKVLIKALIYLILPFKENAENQEREAFEFVENIFQTDLKLSVLARMDKLTDSFVALDNKRGFYEKLKNDFQYFLIWSSRRNNHPNHSLDLANQAIAEDDTDPRFYHGKCLALYNKKKDFDNLNPCSIDVLKELVLCAEIAIDKYKECARTQYNHSKDEKYRKFIEGNIVAVQNTLLYCLSLQHLYIFENEDLNNFEFDSDLVKYSLSYLRNSYLISIKSFEFNQNQDSKDFPELAQTESVLELCEAIQCFKSLNYVDAIYKINKSATVIDKALEFEPVSALYKTTKKKIAVWQKRITSKTLFK